MVWRWALEGSAFGQHPAEADVDGDGVSLEFNLRYPGQYFDSATGWHYNYFRDYEPGTGRYVQSDPIGLGGGVSTFGYVGGAPLRFSDFFGLTAEDVQRAWDQVQRTFNDLAPRGRVECDPSLPEDVYGRAWNVSGNISVNQRYCDKQCFSRDEWEELFLTLFHEGMHSSDPWYQGFFSEAHHDSIYAREQFESDRGNRLRSPRPGGPMWGTPRPQPADFGALYDEFQRGGSQCCAGE
ncbi:MAG: RHS repeat-associated core domain-containing protein [Fimbriimonadaceae bacterium]